MNIPVPNCSSCAACANVCTRDAITMKLDNEGFYRPVIDSVKCVNCGACERACPWKRNFENPNNSSNNSKTFAAFAKDEKIRLDSSSGGIFSILAEKILSENGCVIGVTQLGQSHYGHIVVNNKEDLAKLRGSKYVQADVGQIYREVKKNLQENRKILFSGTPCQIAALYSVLGSKKSENLTTIDIVCHGTPSVKVYEKFIQMKSKEQASSLYKTLFRDKTTGWSTYSLSHFFEKGTKQTIRHEESDYMAIFLSRICQNQSCSDCRYRKLPRIADITLGDYWGISKYHPNMNDEKGTSIVMLNTEHGKKLFDSVAENVEYQESKLEYAIAGNPCIIRSEAQHPRRSEFFIDLDKMDFAALRKKYCPKPALSKRIFRKVRKMLNILKKKFVRQE